MVLPVLLFVLMFPVKGFETAEKPCRGIVKDLPRFCLVVKGLFIPLVPHHPHPSARAGHTQTCLEKGIRGHKCLWKQSCAGGNLSPALSHLH